MSDTPAENVPPSEPASVPTTPAAVKLHCADAITASWNPAEQMERAKVVMQASQRMPAVGFFGVRYGERWYEDIVALPHNAVRRQLYDAFVMANALGKMVMDVPDSDLARVYAWLGSLERFVDATLYAEQRFLFPLVDKLARKNRVTLPDMLQADGRSDARAQILELLATARKTRDVSAGETAAKIRALRYALDQFGANVLDYYGAMEKFLPRFLKDNLRNARAGEKVKEKVERKTVSQMLNEPQGVQLVAMLMQCIESRSKRSAFLHRHFKKEKARSEFKADVKQVQATHMQLARTFDLTATKYEKVFSVNTFMTHFGADVDENERNLAMLGDVELNEDGEMTVQVPQNVTSDMVTPHDPEISDDHIYKVIDGSDELPPAVSGPPMAPTLAPPPYLEGDHEPVERDHSSLGSDEAEEFLDDEDERFVADIPVNTRGLADE